MDITATAKRVSYEVGGQSAPPIFSSSAGTPLEKMGPLTAEDSIIYMLYNIFAKIIVRIFAHIK